MAIDGYLTQEDEILAQSPESTQASKLQDTPVDVNLCHCFLPIDDAPAVFAPRVLKTTDADFDDEVDRITAGVLLREHFYYVHDNWVYALVDSERLKEAGDGAIPGFACNELGDFYKGHFLNYGTLTTLKKWVGSI